jgi:Tol biopolymer transport system component
MKIRKANYLLIFLIIVTSGCIFENPSAVPLPIDNNKIKPTMTQTMPTEISATFIPNPILFSELLPKKDILLREENISPDHKWIVYDLYNLTFAGKRGVFANIMLSQRGSGVWVAVLSEEELVDNGYQFSFSPDNHYLAALSRSGIWIIDLQDLNNKTHYNLPILVGAGFDLTWTPDSKSVLFAVEDEKYILAQLGLDGNIKPVLTISDVFQGKTKLKPKEAFYFRGVTFSPDGSKMAYVSFDPEKEGCPDLWIYDLATKKKELVLGNGCNISFRLIWSPTGSTIAFVSHISIYLFDLNTKSLYPIYIKTEGSTSDRLSWSPDGKRIIFDDFFDSNYHLYAYDVIKNELISIISGKYLLISWGTTDNSIFVEYMPLHSDGKYLQEIRIE